MNTGAPPYVLFVSDLHLSAARPTQTAAFEALLAAARGTVQALYILGDLFEFWLGDDDHSDPHPRVVAALHGLAQHGTGVYVMRGNRDFLFGARFAAQTHAVLLADHHVVDLFGNPTLLMHGDLLCTRDGQYQEFRRYVRAPENQAAFLAHSLDERRRIARETRSGTQASMLEKDTFIMDVDDDTVAATMRRFGVRALIHGHTHRPGRHEFEIDGARCWRVVLGDWYEGDPVVVASPAGLSACGAGEFLQRARAATWP